MALQSKPGKARPYWGDIHNHNAIGYGKGSLDRSYAIARGIGLDFYAFTPHGWWPDLPSSDPAVVAYHQQGFDSVSEAWESLVARANRENQPGDFVAFVAYEWHSAGAGDYHILFPGDGGEIFRADSVGDLQTFVRKHGAIMIPHHIGYHRGWRGTNWEAYAADVSPVIDIFSEHGSTFAADTHLPMRTHSMGGVDRCQTALRQLQDGVIAGFVGSTDNHWGCPGSYAEGLAGVWADSLSREGIFDALRRRRTFAVSGDRIDAWIESTDGAMGDVLPIDSPRTFTTSVVAQGAIDYVELLKNGTRCQLWSPEPPPLPGSGEYLVRLEVGWDGLASRDITHWLLDIDVTDGELISAVPNFCLGEGTTDAVHRVFDQTTKGVRAETWSSRLHPHPVQSIVLQLRGSPDTAISVNADTVHGEHVCGAAVSSRLGTLRNSTPWAAISESFAAPKLCISGCHSEAETRMSVNWTDPAATDEAFYMVRVLQRNGQAAWTSPIWFRG